MISLLDKTLTKLEREIRDLKTAHQLGAGSTKFYRKSVEVTFPGNFNIKTKIMDGEPTPYALVLLYPGGQYAFGTITPSGTYYFNIASGISQTVTVYATCSAQIESLTVEAA